MAVRRVRHRTMKRRPRRKANMIRSLSSPVPDRAFVKLKYTTLSAMNFASSLTAIQFRGNSLFDPDFSGIGHQPMGYDQWAVFYNRYRVYGCSYKITFSNTSTSYQGEVLVQQRPNSVLSPSFEAATESPYKQLRVLPIEGATRPTVIKGYHNCAKIYGVSKRQYRAEQDYAALITANPPVNTFINVYLQNQTFVQSLAANVRVELTYFAEFYERKSLGQS